MGFLKVFRDKRGSYTVEACLVVSAILFALFTLVFGLMLLSQRAMLDAAAKQAAQRGAAIWVDSGLNKSLYYRITSFNSNDSNTINISKGLDREISSIINDYNTASGTKKKMAYIKYLAYKDLSRCLIKPESTKVDISYRNLVIKGQIKVVIAQEIKIPLGFIKSLFWGKETVTLNATGTANVTEPAEYIRNIDLAIEYGNRIKEGMDFESVFDRIKGEAAKE